MHTLHERGSAQWPPPSSPKNLLIVNIIDILNRHTDSQHTLTQREIEQILKDEHLTNVDRKDSSPNLSDLIDCGIYELEYKEAIRSAPHMERNPETRSAETSSSVNRFAVFVGWSNLKAPGPQSSSNLILCAKLDSWRTETCATAY